MSAGRVRQGGVFVEIGADARKFFATLNKVNAQVGKLGSAMAGVGSRMMAAGAGMAAPLVAAGVAGSRFQDVLLNVQASTGATVAELDAVRKAAMAMSQSLGVGPTEAASGFLELLKAGMSVEQVLGGAGKAAIAFAKVGQMAVADAAVVMADAMNVFKVSGDVAANTLSAAADASSTSIEGIAQAFSQVSAVAGLANQSIQDTAASLAVLANAGIKGSDAGTSLKTMLMRLMAPADDAAEAMAQVGLSVQSFRNADGTMKPMVEIIGTLSTALEGMDQAAKDDIFRRIFGQDAIRAAAVMTAAGVDGFNAMREGMAGAMTVGDKYAAMNSGLSGALATLRASLERMAIAITDATGPAFMAIAQAVGPVIDGFTRFIASNKELMASIAQGIAIFTAAGAGLFVLGKALSIASGAMGILLAFANPIGLMAVGIGAMTGATLAFSGALGDMAGIATTTFNGIYDSIASGDLAGAMDVLWAGLYAGWLRGVEAIMGAVDPWVSLFQNTFTAMGTEIAIIWENIYHGGVIVWNNIAAVIMGVVDNMVNGVMAAFDAMVAAVKKSWNWVQSFIVKGYDLAKENQKVDSEMAARRRERETSRPGIGARQKEAERKNAEATRDLVRREDSMRQQADETMAGREEENARRADARRAQTQDAEQNASSASRAASTSRVMGDQYAALLKDIESATTTDQLRDYYGELEALSQNGRLTSTQQANLEEALDDAAERIGVANSSMGTAANRVDPAAVTSAAAGATQSQSEVAGTFSAMAVGGMGFGASLAQKQLDVMKQIEQNTRTSEEGLVAA